MQDNIAKPPKDYYIRDCDMDIVLQNLKVLLRKRNEVFLRGRIAVTEQEMIEYYNNHISQLLKL